MAAVYLGDVIYVSQVTVRRLADEGQGAQPDDGGPWRPAPERGGRCRTSMETYPAVNIPVVGGPDPPVRIEFVTADPAPIVKPIEWYVNDATQAILDAALSTAITRRLAAAGKAR